MSSLMRARYRFVADVYTETAERNRAGQYVRSWDKKAGEIKGTARGILGGGIRVVGSTETWGEDYEDIEWVKMRVGTLAITDEHTLVPDTEQQAEAYESLNRSYRVSNIRRDPRHIRRGQSSTPLWRDESGDPQLFSIVGVQPVLDPYDRMTEWDLLLKGVTGD